MYLDYWRLQKHPFGNVPDPAMYFDKHKSVKSAVSELLFAIQEGDDCLAVVVGGAGVGKTTCLRTVLDSLDKTKYRIAFLTNPNVTFPQLLRTVVGQLQNQECCPCRMDKLLEKFNAILFEASETGKKVVIFIDESNALRPYNLEGLRLLTSMEGVYRSSLVIVLAGQPELAKRLDDARRANLFQRIGVYCKVEGISNRATMKEYIEHRLERAGLSGDSPFTEDAYDALWEVTEHGLPRLINKMCKLSLKTAEINGLTTIGAGVVRAMASRFESIVRRLRKTPARPSAPPVEAIANQPVLKVVQPVPVAIREEAPLEFLGNKEMEVLAGTLAIEKINELGDIVDPFEVWNKAREEILNSLTTAKLKHVAV